MNARLRARAVLCACGLAVAAATARAETVGYTLFYLGREGCPPARDFVAELSARAPWLVETREAPVAIEISFEDGNPIVGVLVLRDAQGGSTTRTVPGTSCREVVSALSLITTMLVDRPPDESPPPEPPPPAVDRPAAAQPPPPPPPRPSRSRQRQAVRFGVGTGASLQEGVAPGATVAGGLELSAEWDAAGLSPLASLSAETTLPSEASSGGGTVSFRWRVLRASACPLRLPLGPAALRPCALFEGGLLEADGYAIEGAASARAPWWSVGASARGELGLHGPLAVTLEGGARYHLRRDSFYFDVNGAERTVFEVPAAGGFARLSLRARW